MAQDEAESLKARLRADLLIAMKSRQAFESRVLRDLVAAIDNAQAPAPPPDQRRTGPHRFESGAAEVPRLRLNSDAVRDVLCAEVLERERSAELLDRLELAERARALRAEASLARRYLHSVSPEETTVTLGQRST